MLAGDPPALRGKAGRRSLDLRVDACNTAPFHLSFTKSRRSLLINHGDGVRKT